MRYFAGQTVGGKQGHLSGFSDLKRSSEQGFGRGCIWWLFGIQSEGMAGIYLSREGLTM